MRRDMVSTVDWVFAIAPCSGNRAFPTLLNSEASLSSSASASNPSSSSAMLLCLVYGEARGKNEVHDKVMMGCPVFCASDRIGLGAARLFSTAKDRFFGV